MKLATTAKILATGMALFFLVFEASASDPIFVKWLVVDDPGDETIRYYWVQAEAGELGPAELVDLGTMLFYRGWPNDAVGYYKAALELDPELSEAWFRIGLAKHHSGDLSGARSAYKKCLKLQSGHGWANFYLGLLEEQTGEAKSAMEHYEMAFKHAPALADPEINPEILSSKLALGAQVRHFDRERFEKTMPMPYLEPKTVREVRRQYEDTPTPTATPWPTPVIRMTPTPAPTGGDAGSARGSRGAAGTAAGAAAGGAAAGGSRSGRSTPSTGSTPYGIPEAAGAGAAGSGAGGGGATPQIGDTSPEASLRPLWPSLYRLAAAVI